MNRIVSATYPTGDTAFARRVHRVLGLGAWEFDSDQDVALLQGVLRTSFPMTAVVVDRSCESSSGPTTHLSVYRDGLAASPEASNAWVGAVYDRGAPSAYRLAIQLLDDGPAAEAVVEQAFRVLDGLGPLGTSICEAAEAVHAEAFKLARQMLPQPDANAG